MAIIGHNHAAKLLAAFVFAQLLLNTSAQNLQCVQCLSDINCDTGACTDAKYCLKRRAPYGDKGYFKVEKGCADTGHPGCKELVNTGGVVCYCDSGDFCNDGTYMTSGKIVTSLFLLVPLVYWMI